MNNKRMAIGVIALALILMGLIIYFIFFYKFGQPQTTNEPATTPTETNIPNENSKSGVDYNKPVENKAVTNVIKPSKEMSEEELKKIAESFVERFGTYSNQANLENISDLKILMTKKMSTWADKYIIEQRQIVKADADYSGVKTVVITTTTKSIDLAGGEAEFLLKTQKKETIGGKETTNYKDIEVKLIKVDKDWKVDMAYWK